MWVKQESTIPYHPPIITIVGMFTIPRKMGISERRPHSVSHAAAFHGGTEAAHLVNFMGTDTVAALLCTKRYYHAKMLFCNTSAMQALVGSWGSIVLLPLRKL